MSDEQKHNEELIASLIEDQLWMSPEIKRMMTSKDEVALIKVVERDGYHLQYIQHQTPKIIFAAIKNNKQALCYAHLDILIEAEINELSLLLR